MRHKEYQTKHIFSYHISRFWTFFFLKVCDFLSKGATQAWDDSQEVPYAYHDNQWVGYDDVRSFTIKVSTVPWTYWGPILEWQESKWSWPLFLTRPSGLSNKTLEVPWSGPLTWMTSRALSVNEANFLWPLNWRKPLTCTGEVSDCKIILIVHKCLFTDSKAPLICASPQHWENLPQFIPLLFSKW